MCSSDKYYRVCVSYIYIVVCQYSVSQCICLGDCGLPLAPFQVELNCLGCLFRPHHVNQGGVQKTSPQVTLHETPTLLKSLSGDTEMSGGRLGLFPYFTLSHTPFPTFAQHPTQNLFQQQGLVRLDIKTYDMLTNIPSEKKKMRRDPSVVWHMGFIRKRDLILWVWGVWIESIPYFICIHLSSYKSYQTSITDTRLSTVGS